MSGRETAELLLLMGRPALDRLPLQQFTVDKARSISVQLVWPVQAEGYRGELSPAQWMALRFFARANQFSRNPSAFAEFQATTRGTASQVIKVLEAGGYLIRQRSEVDGRSVGLRLTDKGKEAIPRDPFEALVRAVDSLDPEEQTAVHGALRRVLTTVAASGEHRHFGICQDCEYLERATRPALECLLFGVPIEPEDAGLLCVHFSAKQRAPRGPIP